MKKNIVGILIIITLLSAIFYLTYNKISLEKENKQTKAELKEMKNELKNIKKQPTTEKKETNTTEEIINGEWTYKETIQLDSQNNCEVTINLNLKEDGTYTYNNIAPCMEGTNASGKYSIYKNIIYLNNDKCNTISINNECIYQNCKPIIELKYEKNQISAPVREKWIKLNKTV